MALTATVSTTQEISLDQRTAMRLMREFRQIQALRAEKAEIEQKIKESVGRVTEIREETGEMSLSLNGYKTTLVASTQAKLNKKRFVALGGSLTMLEEATDIVPKKAYELVSCPGEKAKDE